MTTSDKRVINGKSIAQKHQKRLRREIDELHDQQIYPRLAVIWVGDDPASGSYFRAKERLAEDLGIEFRGWHLPESTSEAQLGEQLKALNNDPKVHGILVEMPLPDHINARVVSRLLSFDKDVDGMTYYNQGRLYVGRDAFIPATPYGVMTLLDDCEVELEGMDAVIIGHSDVVGKPLATLLLASNATVTVCHKYTRNLIEHTSSAGLLCSAAGVPHLVTADMVKPGAIVIDIGYSETEEGVVGDVDFDNVKKVASRITPVRGGIGSMTSTMIMSNTIKAARQIAFNKED